MPESLSRDRCTNGSRNTPFDFWPHPIPHAAPRAFSTAIHGKILHSLPFWVSLGKGWNCFGGGHPGEDTYPPPCGDPS